MAQQSAAQSDTVIRETTRRVLVDIVVTDKKGNTVTGLQKGDFLVTEDNKPQTVLSFDYEDGSVSSYTPPRLPAMPANTYVNVPTEPERGPLYVLYYDMVNTPMEDQMSAHKQLLDFVDHSQPGTRFALFVNASGLHLIQGFTSDHALLHAAILSKGPGPHVPDVFMYGSNYGYSDAGASLQCLKFISDYMAGIPGRKNLLWLASVFPIPVGPTMSGPNTNTGVGGGFSSSTPQISDLTYLLSETIKETYSSMMRSQVALYPVDLEGQNAENDPGNQVVKGQQEDSIAAATGGRAYHGGNRLQLLLDQAVENGESYYTLSYDPSNEKYDGSERHVEVTLPKAQKGEYTLSYRTVYYAVTGDETQPTHTKDVQQAKFVAAKTADTLYANIEHGAPMSHDLLFSVHLAAEGKPKMATAEQMAQLQDTPEYFRTRKPNQPVKAPAPVPLQKYRIGYGIGASQLKLLGNGSGKPAELEFAVAAYDADGRLLNTILNRGQASPGVDAKGKPLAFFHADQELDAPPGAAWLRMAVRDTLTNRTGTLEVRLPLKSEPVSQASH